MLAAYQRFGVIDLAGSVALAVLHTGLAIAWTVPGVATGVYAPTPGRVSVVTYIDQAGPVWQVGFAVTALALVAAVVWPRWLVAAHAVGGGIMTIFGAALWFGWAASEARPSVLTAAMATTALAWHIVLAVTYSAVGSLKPATGGSHRQERP